MPATIDPVSALLDWYDKNARSLPWRAPRGVTPDPYHVWLSEIMLQQTTVITVKPYFEKFLALFPTIEALAAAEDDAVMAAWAGLGYYSRARNLLKCARMVTADYGGVFPDDEAALLQLPGIGPYTAAAIAAIAFNRPAAPVDGNIERVLARLYALETPLPALKPVIKEKNQSLVPPDRPGDFAQAMMDLGATLCTPKRPNCLLCPWHDICQARHSGIEESLPQKAPKKPKPERSGTIYWLENAKGEVLVHRRPEKGLLGGMLCFPSRGWDAPNDSALPDTLPDGWTVLDGTVVHVFTHFRLTLALQAQTAPKGFRKPQDHIWLHPSDFAEAALPSLMQKVWKAVLL
jgi:A/G-specific adenine glycosylase